MKKAILTHNRFKLLLLLLLVLPLYVINAQDLEKKMRVKKITTINGKISVKDTTISALDYADRISGIKGLRVDTAALSRLFREVHISDTLLLPRISRSAFIMLDRARIDTLVFKRLQGSRILISGSDTMALAGKRKSWEEKLLFKYSTADSAATNHIRFRVMKLDTLKASRLDTLKVSRRGEGAIFERTEPIIIFRSQPGEGNIIRLKAAEAGLSALNPKNIEQIIVRKNDSILPLDSMLVLHASKTKFKITTDDKTGEKHLIRIDSAGNEHELKMDVLQLNNNQSTIVIIHKATVTDINAADKASLQEMGKSVETGEKSELRLSHIDFYPNPSSGRLNLEFALEDKGSATIRVLDGQGKEIFSDNLDRQEETYSREIDISQYGSGMYFLQIAQGKKYLTKKILVQ
ncbi:T9SS type A sorting domain-containing protein [Pontibacter harenae]|uniref:T9SS type A sorting domain-containing protein n=1 Tax=Pontibacter harenae TaxID=2894083 RepID=UPI001E597516|nr:T9SS type A sorting domain-containing protein [Pontibacter harenae]MCC9166781.1 T9SS type A sorting domain-containing protein [Pontibacter harenae]